MDEFVVFFELSQWLEIKRGEKVLNCWRFLRLNGGLADSYVLRKFFGWVKLVECVFIVTLAQSTSKDISMLLLVPVVLNFNSFLLGKKSKSEWSVERKDVQGSKVRIGVFCSFSDHLCSTKTKHKMNWEKLSVQNQSKFKKVIWFVEEKLDLSYLKQKLL